MRIFKVQMLLTFFNCYVKLLFSESEKEKGKTKLHLVDRISSLLKHHGVKTVAKEGNDQKSCDFQIPKLVHLRKVSDT